MTDSREKNWLKIFIVFFLVLISFPVIFGYLSSGEDTVFAGYVFNPIDNNSYLGKMRHGYEGDWLFALDYTPNPGEGAFFHGYYLFLGHVGRITGIPLLWVQHLARLAGATALLLVLFRLSSLLFEDTRPRWLGFSLAALGSGLGWLFAGGGIVTADLWVAEAYPFLSAYANAHFPLGLALQVWLVLPLTNGLNRETSIKIFFASLAAAIISPFSIPVVLLVLGGLFVWKLIEKKDLKNDLLRLVLTGLGGGPLLVYYFITFKTHPVLKLWDAQNLTPSPPWWDTLVSFSPLLFLAMFGARRVWDVLSPTWRVMLVWAGLCLVLVYIPFSLQRRFLIGLYIPITMLAAYALETWVKAAPRWKPWIITGVYVFSLLTTLLTLMSGVFGVLSQNEKMFFSSGEAGAMAWINENTDAESLILSGSEMGLFIPAHTGRRVLYGHPFETVNAAFWESAVDGFYAGEANPEFVTDNQVKYIFIGPRENELGDADWLNRYEIVYQNNDVVIYATGD